MLVVLCCGRVLGHPFPDHQVVSPNIYNFDLWKTSGHADHYRDNMFSFDVEKQEYGLKPMNCPGHCVMFGSKQRSYRCGARRHGRAPGRWLLQCWERIVRAAARNQGGPWLSAAVGAIASGVVAVGQWNLCPHSVMAASCPNTPCLLSVCPCAVPLLRNTLCVLQGAAPAHG